MGPLAGPSMPGTSEAHYGLVPGQFRFGRVPRGRYFFDTVTAALAVLLESAAAVALTVTTAGFGTLFGARYSPDVLIVPTDPLPPTMLFTFQIADVFPLFWTVAENCRVVLTLTVAVVGEIEIATGAAAVTSTIYVLETSPSGVLTATGTDSLAAGALPLARNCVADTNVVGCRTAPSNEMVEPLVNPTPLTVRVKAPAGIGDGVTEEIAGRGRIVTAALPVAVGDEVLAARTVTVAGLGTTVGA